MATRRSTRITQVDPWIVGGQGQVRDLFPLPPWVILTGRALSQAARHYLITIVTLTALYLWIWWDWAWWQAFILFPLSIVTARATAITAYLWYKNPTIPLIARRP